MTFPSTTIGRKILEDSFNRRCGETFDVTFADPVLCGEIAHGFRRAQTNSGAIF